MAYRGSIERSRLMDHIIVLRDRDLATIIRVTIALLRSHAHSANHKGEPLISQPPGKGEPD